MFRKTQNHQKYQIESWGDSYFEGKHREKHLVTTYWFLFIPIYRTYTILESTI